MKTNKTIISVFIIIVVLIVGLLLIFSGDKKQSNKTEKIKSTSILSVDKKLHDFGEIDIFSGKVTTMFILSNDGPDDITIIAGTTSCGCTDGSIGGITFGMHEKMRNEFIIPAGASENLSVIYNPLAHGPDGVGLVQRSVFLKTNSSATPELEVRVKALVTKNK